MAADQRYCLNCGARRGVPRVPPSAPAAAPAPPAQPAKAAESDQASRPADVSPLAAVIGIALLGGMLLLGVLIGRGAEDDPAPAQVVTVGESPATPGPGEVAASEWPANTNGFTVQLSTVPKDGATAQTVDEAKQQAISDGAIDAAVLDSDLYASLPPGNYVIYSGVHTERRSAEVALKGLRENFPSAAVVEVASDGGSSEDAGSDGGSTEPPAETTEPTEEPPVDEAAPDAERPVVPGVGGESEIPPTGGATPEGSN